MALQRPMRNLLGSINKATAALPGAERVFEILDTMPQITDAENPLDIQGFRDSIRFENVEFSYGREKVLHGVSLEIKAGQTVAFVGPTGAGKTTLVNLVGRLYEPTSGEVLFDGVDQRKIKQSSLLAQLALVTQEPYRPRPWPLLHCRCARRCGAIESRAASLAGSPAVASSLLQGPDRRSRSRRCRAAAST